MDSSERKLFKMTDIIVFAIVFAVCACFFLSENKGRDARISYNGAVLAEIPLQNAGEYRFDALSGVTFTVEKNGIRISENDCADLICVKTGQISQKGEAIICVPKKISVEITGGDTYLDAVIQ